MLYKRLRNYAEWYYTKYFPSKKMLYEKLIAKCEDAELVERVMSDLGSLIVEKENIESRVHSLLSQGKTTRYIRQKLLQKKFDPDIINQTFSDEEETIKNPETYRAQIEKSIQKGSQKGAPKKSLQYELRMKYSDAKDLIDELLAEYHDLDILQKKAPELLRKYSQEQVMSKLSQKGFKISDIYTVLRRR